MWVKWHWHGRWPTPPWQAFHCNAQNICLAVHFILYPPKKHFFQNGQCFRDCKPSEIYILQSFLYKCEILRGFYLSSYWYLFIYFCLGISEEDALLVKYISCKFCIFLWSTGKHYMCSTQKLDTVWCDDVTSSDLIAHSTSMVNRIQLKYWDSFSMYHIQKTITQRCRWYCLLTIIEYFCHFQFQFFSLYMLLFTHRYGSLNTRTASLEILV